MLSFSGSFLSEGKKLLNVVGSWTIACIPSLARFLVALGS